MQARLRELARTREETRNRVRTVISRYYIDWESALEYVLAGLFADQLKAALAAELRREHAAAAQEMGVLSDQDQAEQVRAVRERLRAVELEEERLIVQSELADGPAILRREDCDPAILFDPEVLRLEDVAAA